MATEIPFSTSVDIGEGAKSMKTLKQEFKDAQKELDGLNVGSEKYVATLKKLGAVKDEIGDLNAEINAFNPEGKVQAFGNVIGGLASGFQAATAASALFGNGNKEVEKTLLKVQAAMAFADGIKGVVALGDSFKVLGNIIKANPIFLIASIIIAIGTALFALKDKIGIVGAAFDAMGKVIDFVIEKGKQFLDVLGLTDFAMQKTTDSIIKNSERIKTATTERYDSEIAAAKRAGKATELLEIAKLSAITKTNDAIIKNIKGNSEEEIKRKEELRKENQKYYQDILNLYDAYKDREFANQEKLTAKNREELAKRAADHKKHIEEIQKNIDEGTLNGFEIDQKRREEKEAQDKLDQENALINAGVEASQLEDIKDEQSEKDRQRILDTFAVEQETREKSLDVSRQGLVAYQNLFDAAFSIRLGKVKKGSAEELKIAKQQFNVNKGLQLGLAIIDGYKAVNASLAYSPVAIGAVPNPVGIASLAFAVTSSLANIAKIASTQFNSTGGGGGVAAIQAPTLGGAPNINAPQNSNTTLDPDGTVRNQQKNTPIVIQNNINETEIHKVRKRIDMIESAATIG